MAAAAARIHKADQGGSGLSGQLRVSVSEGFGNSFIAPRLGRFVAAHPELEIDLVASSGFLNPSRREADMAVLLARPRKGPLIPRKQIGRATSELQSLMRTSYAVFCMKKKKNTTTHTINHKHNEVII